MSHGNRQPVPQIGVTANEQIAKTGADQRPLPVIYLNREA
jgi:hypothetical protein